MVVFDASTLILIAKVGLLDLFLTNVSVPVAIPGEVEKECCRSTRGFCYRLFNTFSVIRRY